MVGKDSRASTNSEDGEFRLRSVAAVMTYARIYIEESIRIQLYKLAVSKAVAVNKNSDINLISPVHW